jgi:hypothetical protein
MRLARGDTTAPLSDSHQLFVSSLRKVLTKLVDSGRQVILVGQVPLPPTEFISCITRARFKGWDENGCALEEFSARAETEHSVNQLLRQAFRISNQASRLCILTSTYAATKDVWSRPAGSSSTWMIRISLAAEFVSFRTALNTPSRLP